IIDIPAEERKALTAAISLFESKEPLKKIARGHLIDAYNRYGMVLYKDSSYIDAEKYYQKAAESYKEAVKSGQIKPEAKYGLIFSNLGDLAYNISGDYDIALDYFIEAENNKYSTPNLKYKKGFLYYNKKDYRDALDEFTDSADGYSSNRTLLYATANTLFNRNDFYLAEGYYTHLLDMLEKEYSSINYLLIDTVPEHKTLVENLIKVKNNLGTTKYRLYQRNRNSEKNSEAMVLLTDSIELYDKLSRDPNSLEAPETVNLSYLNSKSVFYPVDDYQLQIYQDIPKDLDKSGL
ncbi:MAG: tetratricopeptide repeat protein, partial [Spirochaetales bacterium]|nr:tetratricopeptide repeat protein [Spirochaetales bacterium]